MKSLWADREMLAAIFCYSLGGALACMAALSFWQAYRYL